MRKRFKDVVYDPSLDLPNEEWRQVSGWGGYYFVSSYGRLRSLDRVVPHWRGGTSVIKGVLFSNVLDRNGYTVYKLHYNKECKMVKAHRLVAIAFIANPNRLNQVNHIDGNSTNNHYSNLEWVSPHENSSHINVLTGGFTSPLIGASLIKTSGMWKSQISFNGRVRHLGCFKTDKEAHLRYLEEVDRLGIQNKYARVY